MRLTCPAILAVASGAVPTIGDATYREAGGGHAAQEGRFAHPTVIAIERNVL